MDILFQLLKLLAANMTIGQFLGVLATVAVAIGGTIVFIANRTGSSLFDLIKKKPKDPVDDKIELLKIELKTQHDKLGVQYDEIFKHFEESTDLIKHTEQLIRKQATDLLTLKRELTTLASGVASEMVDLKTFLRNHDSVSASQYDVIKSSLHSNEELLQRLLAKMDKIDDYTRNSLPEFKQYHRELDTSLRQMHTDIAIIANLLRINNTSTTLR